MTQEERWGLLTIVCAALILTAIVLAALGGDPALPACPKDGRTAHVECLP